jgi:hypothetical protein
LGDFVGRKPAQPFAHRRQARIVGYLGDDFFQIQMHHLVQAPLRVRHHRSKFVERESAAIETAASLAENPVRAL